MKKFLAVLMAAMLLALTFAGCSSSGDNTDEESTADTATEAAEVVDDLATITAKGTLVVGITDYAPMDYKEEGSDEWTGFDAEFATAFAESLGVTVEFIEIDWDNKFFELESGEIDCIWNGMTITDEVKLNTSVSDPYVVNKQVVVMAADVIDNYADAESMAELSFAVESGSAGESAAADNGLTYTAVNTQSDALMEVASGNSDACIIDSTMADAMTGEGTDYADLTSGLVLTDEEYGVGFRTNSNLTEVFNEYLVSAKDDVITPLAEKYDLVLAY
ncbi:MAG: transporter substrate-binding domain-containing protein [Clostridiales bacterium]|nr:transporter substrate-binding domain-containing protein [Clostridiales bacterium]